jgi:hypothetical protein
MCIPGGTPLHGAFRIVLLFNTKSAAQSINATVTASNALRTIRVYYHAELAGGPDFNGRQSFPNATHQDWPAQTCQDAREIAFGNPTTGLRIWIMRER